MNNDTIEVIPALTGGVGNQMFQIAMAHVFARQVGGVAALDENVWSSGSQGHGPHHYSAGLFSKLRRTTLQKNAHQVFEGQWSPGCRPQLKLPASVKQVFIQGYWQLPALWECEPQEIRNLFQFEVKRSSCSGVHIRGGDYRRAHQPSRDSYHRQPGPLYYEQAIANLSKSPNFYSDDPTFVSQLAPDVRPISGSETDHLREMAGCSELVISKSTFSWWAAFLGAVPFVIMPAAWFWNNEFQPSWVMRHDGWKILSPNSTLWDFHHWNRDTKVEPEYPNRTLDIPPEEWAPWESRTEILNDLLCLTGGLSYLEIGCGKGLNLRAIECHRKTGVDVVSNANACDSLLYKLEPEEYFEQHQDTVDIILVAGIHNSSRLRQILKLAAHALSVQGVLVCEGLKENDHFHEWRNFQMEMTGWIYLGVDCENGIGLAFPRYGEFDTADSRECDLEKACLDTEGEYLLPPNDAKRAVCSLLSSLSSVNCESYQKWAADGLRQME